MQVARIMRAAGAALIAALVCGGLVATPAAHAAITGSRITTPTDPSFFVADQTTAAPTFAISGTTSGGHPATDKVDVRCFYAAKSVLVANNVAIAGDGSFSVPAAPLDKVIDLTCRLRAVPAGTSPSNLAPYTGPLIGVGERDSSTVGGGANNGKLYDYYLDAQQGTGAFDYVSLGACGLKDGYLLDPTYALTTSTFFCDGGLLEGESGTSSTRSELRVDGADAYAPATAESINPNAAGLPALSYSYSVDAHTGNLVVHETDPLVKCPVATFPPTTTSCASFVSTGVTDNRTITQDHDGHVSWITDVFTSTDGKPHSLDLLWDDSQHFRGSSTGDSSQLEYEFPGPSSFSRHLAGDVITFPASSPGTILVRMFGAPDGDTATGQGAIVYDRPASAATFTTVSKTVSEFTLGQTAKVPAGGSTRFRFAYVQDYHAATVASLAQTASTAFLNTVAVSRSGRGTGKVTSVPAGIACGRTCSHGFGYGTPIVLKATAARGSRFVRWSGACKGSRRCRITTTGNTAVRAKFVFRPCLVPNLVGKTLLAAKRALTRAFCALGKVTTLASTRVKGDVIAQSPARGKRLKHQGRVSLVVSAG